MARLLHRLGMLCARKPLVVIGAWFVLLVVVFVPAWFGGLWLLDAAFTGFASPVAHLQHILDYGLSLTRVTAINQESYPWQWLINEVPMTYLRTDEQTIVNGEVVRMSPTGARPGRAAVKTLSRFLAPKRRVSKSGSGSDGR